MEPNLEEDDNLKQTPKIEPTKSSEPIESSEPVEPPVSTEPKVQPLPSKETVAPRVSSEQTKTPNFFQKTAQKIKNLFSKENPHQKRNIIITSSIGLLLIIGIIVGIIVNKNASLFASIFEREIEIVDVKASKVDNGILASDSSFVIETNNGSIEKLSEKIFLEPAVDYKIQELIAGKEYEIIPSTKLPDNLVVNIDSVKNEVVNYKWAFQTKKELSVSGIYPRNGANYVASDSVIEVNFSYPNVEDFENHFKIEPAVEGTFAKTKRGWRFSPNEPLANDTTYNVTVLSGLSYGGEIMKNDYNSSFSTFAREVTSSSDKDNYISLDTVTTFLETEAPMIDYGRSAENAWEHGEEQGNYFEVHKYASADDYIRHLKGENVSKELLGKYDFTKIETSSNGYEQSRTLRFNSTLPSGYYEVFLKTENGSTILQSNIEVNNLSVYAFESERDALIWVTENGELKSDININYKGKDYKTSDNGLLVMDNFSDYSDQLEYFKIGDNNPLVLGLKNFKNDLYPTGYIYTDRLLYKSNDVIKIWGFVPLRFFADDPDLKNFNIKFDEIKKSVEMNPDGTFSTEIALNNYKEYSDSLVLTYNDSEIAYRFISVENYTLENYTYEFVMDKNFILSGEDIKFNIKVTHVTGFPASNKDLVVTYNKHDYYSTTNYQGVAEFTIKNDYELSNENNRSVLKSEYLEVKSAGEEYNKYSTGKYIYVFRTNLNLSGENSLAEKKLLLTAKNLDLSSANETDWSFKNLIKNNYNGPATIRIYETRHSRRITSYRYDDYEKKNLPVYDYNTSKSLIKEESIEFNNGTAVYEYPTDFKESEKDAYYTYHAVINATDSLGRPSYSYDISYYSNYYQGESYYGYNNNNAIEAWSYNAVGNYMYNVYKYGIKDNSGKTSYTIGDSLSIGMYDSNNENVNNSGKILLIGYKEKIINYSIFDGNNYDYSFNNDSYPGLNMVGAYFVNGKFIRLAPKYFDYDTSNSELTVKIETNQESYEPKDTVKAKVIVEDKNNNKINSGKVNLSVVNEAVFNAGEDSTRILDSIYSNKNFKGFAYSSFRDFSLTNGGGGMGGGGDARSNFGDCIFFGTNDIKNGEAEFEFKLNDSITSFRLTAHAVEDSETINAGVAIKKISSFLPLSISTVAPKSVKNTDDLVVNAKSVVSGSENIKYKFEIKELGKEIETSARVGESTNANFGKLDLGKYTIIISGEDEAGNKDKLSFEVNIVETAQEVSVKKNTELSNGITITPAKNPIIVEIYNRDTKKYLDYLDYLESNFTSRLDTKIAYYKAQEYKNKYYEDSTLVATPTFNNYLSDNGVLRNLENSEDDYVLTALANYYAKDYFELKQENFNIDVEDSNEKYVDKLLVLASFKEPILLELNSIKDEALNSSDTLKLGLAYAFLGDYNSAKELYRKSHDDGSLFPILASFIDKTETSNLIDESINQDSTEEYLCFAVISFFINNEADLKKTATVEVVTQEYNEEFKISGLEVKKRTLYMNELNDLNFKTNSTDLMATYYYQGKLSELGNFEESIPMRLEGQKKVGSTVDLVLDISNLSKDERNGVIHVALPASLKFSATFSGQNGLYLGQNNNEHFKLNLSDSYTSNEVRIPLYVSSSGNYELEPIIYRHDGNYYISNNLFFDLD